MTAMSDSLRLLHQYDNVHLIVHKDTGTYFAVHKDIFQRSMTFVTAFVCEENARNVMRKMDSYRQTSGIWPNRLLGKNTAYLWELHEDDYSENEEYLDLTTTHLGHLQKVIHFRNIAVEIVYELNVRPQFRATVVTSPPRTDMHFYTAYLEHAFTVPSDVKTRVQDLEGGDST